MNQFIMEMGDKPRKDCQNEDYEKSDLEHGPEFKKPIDPIRILQILKCRRKIQSFVESMLEPKINHDELKLGEKLICKGDYDSIVQERFIVRLCGYPLCSNELKKEWKQRYHISLNDKKIYDVEYRKLYCSSRCMDLSNTYRNDNLEDLPIWMRPDSDTLMSINCETQTSTP